MASGRVGLHFLSAPDNRSSARYNLNGRTGLAAMVKGRYKKGYFFIPREVKAKNSFVSSSGINLPSVR